MSRHDEDGFTLVELLVVLGLMSIVGVMMAMFLNQTLLTTSRANSNADIEKQTQLALRQITADVRAASTLRAGTPSTTACSPTPSSFPTAFANCLSFDVPRSTSSADTCAKSTITYGLVAGTLREDRTDWSLVGATCTAKQLFTGKVVLSGLVNTSSDSLFTYFNNYTNQITSSSAVSVYQGATRTVMVTLRLRAPHTKADLVFRSTVALRNNR